MTLELYRSPQGEAVAIDMEARQRQTLRRNRAIATGLLLTMVGGFVATGLVREPGFWIQLLHAVTEAGVVGGLADWFAVTAVFRRPLGLPIPHTAIVPRSKERIAEGLGGFLERHFLTEELVLAKLRAFDPIHRLAAWMAAPGHADAVADRLVQLLPSAMTALDDEELRAFAARALAEQLREIDVASLLARGIGLMEEGGYHEAVLDRALGFALDFLDEHGDTLELTATGTKRRWWMPKAVDRQIARVLVRGARDLLEDLQDPRHETRQRLLQAIDEFARDLLRSPDQRARVERAKLSLLAHPDIQRWLSQAWDRVRDLTLADVASPDSKTRRAIATALASGSRTVLADAQMRGRLDAALERAVLVALPWRRELARFIAEVIRRWDERMLVERLELVVGGDLQYVRMTGTIVGGIIGCLLFLVAQGLK
jgi:uncharacterized membrane-anchored protein YjiN (DUF445 family)